MTADLFEAWCSVQSVNVTANALLATPLAMAHCSVKEDAIQTDSVDFCLVEYMFNQLPAESQLSTLSKL